MTLFVWDYIVMLSAATNKEASLLQCNNINKKKYEKFMNFYSPLAEPSEKQPKENQEDYKDDRA